MIFGPRRGALEAFTIPAAIRQDTGCIIALDSGYGLYQDVAGTIRALVDNDPIAMWRDQSTAAAHPTQASGASRPLLRVNSYNSRRGVRMAASTTRGLIRPGTIASPFTMFVLWRSDRATSFGRAVQGSNNWLMGPREDGGSMRVAYYANNMAGFSAFTPGGAVIHMVTQSTGTGEHWKDGVAIAGTVASPNAPSALYIGNPLGASGVVNEPLDGEVIAVLGFNRQLAATDSGAVVGRKTCEAWLSAISGISVPP